MRLLETDNIELREFTDHEIPPYAILSHTWGAEEITLRDLEKNRIVVGREGYEKIKQCCSVAADRGFKYLWVDTCCIDKTSSAELSEAINSMYRWYEEAGECYAYLSDVPSKVEFSKSRWFTRGWTLQELIAPSAVIFFNEKWKVLGTKEGLKQVIYDCTRIPANILSGKDGLETLSVAQKMSWAAKRETTRVEDRAYSLLGIFGIHMPLIYGEKETAFIRLQEEIMKISDDHTLFAWKSGDNRGGLLATSPAAFIDSSNIVEFTPFDTVSNPLTVSSRGVHLELRFVGANKQGLGLVVLHCKERDGGNAPIAIFVRDSFLTMSQFERVRSETFQPLDLGRLRPSQYPLRRVCIRKGRVVRTQKLEDPGNYDNLDQEDFTLELPTNPTDAERHTTLLQTVQHKHEGDLWLLLARSDFEASLKGKVGQQAFLSAAKREHKAIIKMLLARSEIKADLVDEGGMTPLTRVAQAGYMAALRALLDSGKVNIEFRDRAGHTPLSWAARHGHEPAVELLLKNGANIESRDDSGRTPLSYAASSGNEATVRILIENRANINSEDEFALTPLSRAVKNNDQAIVKLLLEKGADFEANKRTCGKALLLWAAENGHKEVAKLLLEKGADVEAKNSKTVLSWAAFGGHTEMVELLLEKGADIEAKAANYHNTPLFWAAENGHRAVVELLLEKGANVRGRKDFSYRMALSSAAKNGREAVVELLVGKGPTRRAR
jgi:ankyrin repeat protein